jgi:hypothetical protein
VGLSYCIIVCKSKVILYSNLFAFAEGGATTDSVPWCGIKARVVAEHLHRDASMISRLHAAYVEKRDKRSESELQRRLKIKSITHA